MSEVTQTAVVNLTDAASTKVRDLLTREGRDDLALRIAVEPGGCSACGTRCSSTTAPSTATSAARSAACRSSPTK